MRLSRYSLSASPDCVALVWMRTCVWHDQLTRVSRIITPLQELKDCAHAAAAGVTKR
jgi:hypothetical protein